MKLLETVANSGEEIYACEDREGLIRALKARGETPEKIAEKMEHEDAHADKARQLGYKPVYVLAEFVGSDLTTGYRAGIAIYGNPTDSDLLEILSAPAKLSTRDLRKIELLIKKICLQEAGDQK
jgi:hypothetical protein